VPTHQQPQCRPVRAAVDHAHRFDIRFHCHQEPSMTLITYRHYARRRQTGQTLRFASKLIYPDQEDVVVLIMTEEVAALKDMCRRHIARINTRIEVTVRRARDLTTEMNLNEEMTLFLELGHCSAHHPKRGRSPCQTTPLDYPPNLLHSTKLCPTVRNFPDIASFSVFRYDQYQ
jgi:hypothetical protein